MPRYAAITTEASVGVPKQRLGVTEAGDVISGESVKTIESYAMLNFEVASFGCFPDIQKSHFVTAAAKAEPDIDGSIKRKRIRVSLNATKTNQIMAV